MPASSKAQQRLMGLVKAVQAGDVPKSKVSKAVQKMADKMKEKDVDKYASTKHKGLPNKVQSEETLNENPAVIATAARMAIQNADGKKVSVNTARQPKYADRDPSTHKKAKSIFQRIKDKFMKKDKPKKSAPKKQSKGDAEYYARQYGGKLEQKIIGRLLNTESVESNKLEELVGKPITEAQFDEAAGKKDACYHKVKARYDVWPSAYASGALVKCRKVGAKNWGNSKK